MAASQTTQYYQLPIYEPDDVTSWLVDFNGAMEKIDTAIHEAAQSGGGSVTIVQTTGQSETSVMSQKAVTDAINAGGGSVAVVQTTGQSETSVMSQKAVTDSLSDLSNTVNTALAGKQDTLIGSGEGQNIKTINGEPIVGEGNIAIAGGGVPTVYRKKVTFETPVPLTSSGSNPTNTVFEVPFNYASSRYKISYKIYYDATSSAFTDYVVRSVLSDTTGIIDAYPDISRGRQGVAPYSTTHSVITTLSSGTTLTLVCGAGNTTITITGYDLLIEPINQIDL